MENDKCQFCGADPSKLAGYTTTDGRVLGRWCCDSDEHVSGRVMRGSKCYESQLAAYQAVAEAARKYRAAERAVNKRLRIGFIEAAESQRELDAALAALPGEKR